MFVHKVPFTALRLPENSSSRLCFLLVFCSKNLTKATSGLRIFGLRKPPNKNRGRLCNRHFLDKQMTRNKFCLVYRSAIFTLHHLQIIYPNGQPSATYRRQVRCKQAESLIAIAQGFEVSPLPRSFGDASCTLWIETN
jgi:hypothetical protein